MPLSEAPKKADPSLGHLRLSCDRTLRQMNSGLPFNGVVRLGQKAILQGDQHMSALPSEEQTLQSDRHMSASLIGRFGSSAFKLSTTSVVGVAHGLALLFGIGTEALPLWDPRMRRTNLRGGLTEAEPGGHTISPHPSSREGHHPTMWWSLCSFLSRLVAYYHAATACCRIQ